MHQRYHPISDSLWDDSKLEEVVFEGKGFFAFLCSNRRQRPSGIYRASDNQLSADTGLTIKSVKIYLLQFHPRLVVRDGHWIFVRNYFKRQPKQERLLIGAEADVSDCDSKVILEAFAEQYPMFSKWSSDRLLTYEPKPFPNPIQLQPNPTQPNLTLPPPRAVPEQTPWGSPEDLAKKYNAEATDNCPAVTTLSKSRIEKAKRYLRQFPAEEWWTVTFAQYHRSRFLSGKTEGGDGHKNFQPDFDWLLSNGKDGSENAVKVHDGRYQDA